MDQDFLLQQGVLEELKRELGERSAQVGVAVRRGVVTLSGHVESSIERQFAEVAAQRVRGVRAVAQELDVITAVDKKRADDEIAVRAANVLEWHFGTSQTGIAITVRHGVVELSGDVDWAFQSREAEAELAKLGGVHCVVNRIRVNPQVHAAKVAAQINSVLGVVGAYPATPVVAEVIGSGRVRLQGRVRDLCVRAAAERAAWSVPGVSRVENCIRIDA